LTGVFIVLSEKTQSDGGDRIVTPRLVQRAEQITARLPQHQRTKWSHWCFHIGPVSYVTLWNWVSMFTPDF